MLENPIIVSDEDIKEGDLILPPSNIIVRYDGPKHKYDEPLKCWKKVIAQSHQIDWNGLESKFGYIDIEKLTRNSYVKHSVKDDRLSLDEQIQRSGGFHVGFNKGFKKAQELIDKKFSLEDVREAMQAVSVELAAIDGELTSQSPAMIHTWIEKYLKELSKPKSFKIEVEMEAVRYSEFTNSIQPKIINNKIKIIKKL